MDGTPSGSGSGQAQRRARLHALGIKAKRDPQSLSLEDLDAIVDLVTKVSVSSLPRSAIEEIKAASLDPFEPLLPSTHPRAEAQIYLHLAYAAEYIASRVYGLAKVQYEAAVDARWKADRSPSDT